MLKRIFNNKAQAVMGEYVLTFFLIIGVMSAMTIFLKRGLAGRIRDARVTMEDIVINRASGQYVGNFYSIYEPYYVNTVSTVNRAVTSAKNLMPSAGFTSGIYNETIDESTSIQTQSSTAPAQLAD